MTVQAYLQKVDAVNAAGRYKPDWDSLSRRRTPAWFEESKFGIFIHWGVFSIPAAFSEWYPRHMYIEGSPEHEDFKRRFGDMKHFGYKDLIPLYGAEVRSRCVDGSLCRGGCALCDARCRASRRLSDV